MQTLTSKIDSISEVFSEPINVAAEWMSSYLTSATDGEQPQLSKPQMRAYGLWHHGGLEIGDIARIWRDPPLKGGTVATYILEAIRVGELPYEKERARKAFSMTPSLLKDRFKVLETELYGGAVDGGAVEVEVEEEEKTTVVVVG